MRPTQDTLPHILLGYTYGAFTLFGTALQPISASQARNWRESYNSTFPVIFITRFGLPYTPFARRYSGHHYCFLLLPVLRCFVSRSSRSLSRASGVSSRQEVSFGNPGFKGCMRLPRAFRRLPRPSSAPEPSHSPGGFFVSLLLTQLALSTTCARLSSCIFCNWPLAREHEFTRCILMWTRRGLNPRPPACKAGALPLSYRPSIVRYFNFLMLRR